MFLAEKIQLIYFNPNCTKNKGHSDNFKNNNYNIKNRIGDEKL